MKNIFSFLAISVLLFACKSTTSTPKGTVTAFIETMKKGDIEGVKKLVTKSDLSMLNLIEGASKLFGNEKNAVEMMKKEFLEKTKNVSFSIKEEKIDGDKAEVNVEIKENDKTNTQNFKLLKEDGNWKLSLVSTGINMAGANPEMDFEDININDSIKKGMEQLKGINLDSLSGSMKEAIEKINVNKDKIEEAAKKIEEAAKKLEQK
jgi:limonene-1,2-epoxide hydrolase